MNFECFPKRNKQASHLNVCLLLLRVLVCMRLKKIDFCCQLGTLTYHIRHCIMFHHLCSPVSSNPSDGLQPPRFQPWTMTPSSWWLVSSAWWHIIHYSMDPDFQHRSSPQCHIQQDDLYLCRFPSLLIAVLHALPKIPNLVSSFHSDSAWNFKEQSYRKQPSTPSSILAVFHQVCVLQGFYFHVTPHNFLPMARSAPLWPAS